MFFSLQQTTSAKFSPTSRGFVRRSGKSHAYQTDVRRMRWRIRSSRSCSSANVATFVRTRLIVVSPTIPGMSRDRLRCVKPGPSLPGFCCAVLMGPAHALLKGPVCPREISVGCNTPRKCQFSLDLCHCAYGTTCFVRVYFVITSV